MRMRFWGILAVFGLGLLIMGSQGFAMSQTLRLQRAAERRAARQVLAAELERLAGADVLALAGDSVVFARVVDEVTLRVEVVTGYVAQGGLRARVRVRNEGGLTVQEHETWLTVKPDIEERKQ